jgi:hypothetical protein
MIQKIRKIDDPEVPWKNSHQRCLEKSMIQKIRKIHTRGPENWGADGPEVIGSFGEILWSFSQTE